MVFVLIAKTFFLIGFEMLDPTQVLIDFDNMIAVHPFIDTLFVSNASNF